MKITFGSEKFNPRKKSVIAMGVFDGVHRGHREIFRQVVQRSKTIKGTSVVYTFDPHPVKVLAPLSAPVMINTIPQRATLITSTGIEEVIVENFTKKYAQMTPEVFFQKIVVSRLKAQELFVGYNFTFGIHRSGTIEHLELFGKRSGIKIHIVAPYLWKETLVSSTQVRQFLSQAKLAEAEELLARPYFIEGKVVKGRGIGGRELGFHTANLKPDNESLLPTGVYVTYTWLKNKRYHSLTNIGPNPTFGAGPVTIESHLLDRFHKNILGQPMQIEFLEKIREEIRFSTPEELGRQIRRDIDTGLQYFKKRERKKV